MLNKTLLALTLATLAGPTLAETEAHPGNHWNQGGVVHVSCFRGPWREVIWDRPQGIFIDSLVQVGYDFPSALAIATRLCRDITYVGDDAAIKAEMERIIAEAPH